MSGRRSQTFSPAAGCSRAEKSQSRCSTESNQGQGQGQGSRQVAHSSRYSYSPPVYSEYPTDMNPSTSSYEDQSFDLDSRTAAAYCDQLNSTLVNEPPKKSSGRHKKHKRPRSALGSCFAEGDLHDPLGMGPELMEEFQGTMPDQDMSVIYPLITMANTSKFLFDGTNMIRLAPKNSVKQMFGANPNLYWRVKQFVRQRTHHEEMLGTRATPELNEPHREISEKDLHHLIGMSHH